MRVENFYNKIVEVFNNRLYTLEANKFPDMDDRFVIM